MRLPRSPLVALLLAGACASPAGNQPPTTPAGSADPAARGGAALAPLAGGAGGSTATKAEGAASRVKVSCVFNDGWASLVPVSVYTTDEYLMQALIGFTEDARFWRDSEYSSLEPYAARRCGPEGVVFQVPAGRYHLVVGRADTFGANGEYRDNGFDRELEVPGDPEILVAAPDLTKTWPCISCPHLYAWDGARWVFVGEILRDRIGAGAERLERTRLTLPIVGGELRLRVAEEREEVTHLDALAVEVGGRRLRAAAALLADADGARAVLARGDALELTFRVDAPDGPADVTVLATGYYLPAWRR